MKYKIVNDIVEFEAAHPITSAEWVKALSITA